MEYTKPLFSFIIPVYNVEKYLNQCVDSILKQEYKNFEIILVDDGSPDNCGKICDEYAEKDKRVHVYHKENGGLSDARNYGLKRAVGEYILFVDSDDFIFENVLTEIAIACEKEKYDIIYLKAYKYFGEVYELIEVDGDLNFNDIDSRKKFIKYISGLDKFPCSAWGKVLNREFVINNNLFFEKGLLSEDIDWMIRLLKCVSNYYALNKPYYYYRQNVSTSITKNITSKNINSLLKILKMHSNKNPDEEIQNSINSILAYEYLIILANYVSLSEDDKKNVDENIYDFQWILKYNNNLKVKLVYFLKKIFGIKVVACLLNKFLKSRWKK